MGRIHNLIDSGLPTPMDGVNLAEAEMDAEALLVEEADRTRLVELVGHQACPDSGVLSDADIASLKERFPILADFSDGFIRTTPRGDLMKIQSTACKLKEAERSKDVDDKLASNKAKLATRFTKVPEGKDNRWTSLHVGRFLGGAGCSATKLWLTARGHMELSGFPPIGNYDMGAVGMAGHVSARGWAELHNPQSSRLSIKLFSINNCSGRSGSKADTVHSNFAEDIIDIGEFKLALRAMRIAFHFAMPWNFCVEALEGFFFLSNYCHVDLLHVDKKAQMLTQFTDYVIGQNCERWRDSEPFLTTGELKTTWSAFFHARPQAAIADKAKKQQNNKSAGEKKAALGICFAYNSGNCTKPVGTCFTFKGKALKHVCDFVVDKSKPTEVCGKDHTRKGNH